MNKPTDSNQQAIKDAFIRCISVGTTLARDEQLLDIERGDPKIAAEVRALLGEADAGSPIEKIFGFVADSQLAQTDASSPSASDSKNPSTDMAARPGTVIGHYKLLEQIGEGGMGAVFMAQQTEPIKRKVALKLIKPGMDTGQVVARFEAERQALALMDHPNIARVLDAGTTQQGRPYFVMELVRGIPITEYCISKKLSIDARLKLFIDVCHGVQHAHQKGIIHRDLKPNNMLVTLHDGKPVVKIIDFGIAKAISQDLTERTLFTNFAQLIGTPLYMSPEQAELSGLDIDTRSDVYSLGVLLYELLTGTTPFDRDTLKKVGIEEIRRMIRETDPLKPSQRISTLKAQADSTQSSNPTRDLRRSQLELQGELDWIVMKSLEKERERRYESASSFAADVQRYLDDEPVLACPPSYTYRLKKLARQYRRPLAIAVALLLTMFAATVISVQYAFVANAARRESESERIKTEEQRRLADDSRKRAEELEADAVRQREVAHRNLYVADMRLASIDFRSKNIPRLHKTMNAQQPKNGQEDYRDWEWYFMHASTRQESMLIGKPNHRFVDWTVDGSKIASGGENSGLTLLKANDLSTIRDIDSGNANHSCVSWSPDNQQLAWLTLSDKSGVFIWDSVSDKVRTMHWNSENGRQIDLVALAWSPDGKRIAAGNARSQIRFWDVATDDVLHDIAISVGSLSNIAWSPDGTLLVGVGNGVQVWEAMSGKLVFDYALERIFKSVAISVDGAFLIAGGADGKCDIIDIHTHEQLKQFQANTGAVEDLAANPAKSVFATAGSDGAIHCWSLPSAKRISSYYGHEGSVVSIAWDPEGKQLVSGCEDDTIRIWPFPGNAPIQRWDEKSPDGELNNNSVKSGMQAALEIAVLNDLIDEVREEEALHLALKNGVMTLDDNGIRRYISGAALGDLPRPTKLCRLATSDELSNGIVWSNDHSKLLTIRTMRLSNEYSMQVELWNAKAIKQLYSKTYTKLFSSPIYNAWWSPDSSRVAIVGSGGFQIVDSDSGKFFQAYAHHSEQVTSCIWDPTRTHLLTGTKQGVLRVFDVESGKELTMSKLHESEITCLACSPNGRRIATQSKDGQTIIVDSEGGGQLLSLDDGELTTKRLAWSSDGMQLVSRDQKGEILVWNASRGYEYDKSVLRTQDMKIAKENDRSKRFAELIQRRRILGETGTYEDVITLLTDALNDPELKRYMFMFLEMRAGQYAKLGQYDKELKDHNRILTVFSNDSRLNALRDLAEVKLSLQKGNFQKAAEYATEKLHSRPNQAELSFYRAQAFVGLKQWSEALADCERYNEALPLVARGWSQRALVEENLLRNSDAIASWSKAIELGSPQKAVDLQQRGRLYVSMDELEKACQDFRILFYEHNSIMGGFFVAEISRLSGDASLASQVREELLNKVVDQTTDEEKAFAVKACFISQASREQTERALVWAKSMYQNGFQTESTGLFAGYLLFRLGRYDEAMKRLSELPEPPAMTAIAYPYFMAMTHWNLGHSSEAIEWLVKANSNSEAILASGKYVDRIIKHQIKTYREEATKLINIGSESEGSESVAPKEK